MADSFSPGSDYDAALWGMAVGIQTDRRFLEVTGKAPGDMLNGLITNSLPGPTVEKDGGTKFGTVSYSALLTARGRMISDLRAWRGLEEGFLLDLPEAGWEGAFPHFKKYLPPRLARMEDHSGAFSLLTLLGPEAPQLLAKTADEMGVALPTEGMADLKEGEELVLPTSDGGAFRVVREGDYHAEGWNLLLPASLGPGVRDRLVALGAELLTEATQEILRVEKGRPAFGKDMDESSIPVEAGLGDRAIDNGKGCYTGQEVIIRIRDRGHVNKSLRGLLLGDAPIPSSGQELFQPRKDKSVGWITSAVSSPAFNQTVALGYLRRGVEPGDSVRVGGPGGAEGQVRALSDEGWILE